MQQHRVADLDDDDSGIFSSSGKSDGVVLPASTTLIFTNSKSDFAHSKTSIVMGKKFHHEDTRNKSLSLSGQVINLACCDNTDNHLNIE